MRTSTLLNAFSIIALIGGNIGCQHGAEVDELNPDRPATNQGDAARIRAQKNGEAVEDPFSSVPRMTVEELAAALKEGRAVAVDVRPLEAYEAEHIEGAVSMPEGEVVERAGELSPDKLAVTYCA